MIHSLHWHQVGCIHSKTTFTWSQTRARRAHHHRRTMPHLFHAWLSSEPRSWQWRSERSVSHSGALHHVHDLSRLSRASLVLCGFHETADVATISCYVYVYGCRYYPRISSVHIISHGQTNNMLSIEKHKFQPQLTMERIKITPQSINPYEPNSYLRKGGDGVI